MSSSAGGFAPRQGFAEIGRSSSPPTSPTRCGAAASNLQGEANFLEQAMYVDRLGESSVRRLERAARRAWAKALPRVLAEAQACSDADASDAAAAAAGSASVSASTSTAPRGERR
jgi:hypothetical protein